MASGESPTADGARRRPSPTALIDNAYFFLGAVAAGWLAYLALSESFSRGFEYLWFLLVVYLLLAYLLLPRIHSMLTYIYVPDYFIGRARTHEGLLGDPVNLALFGSEAQVHTAMIAAGWNRADEVGFRSALRIITSTLLRRSYSDAPVSPLYLFGTMQDFTYQQEVAGNPAKRHHVRFWRTPSGWLLPGGYTAEWMAAGTYDRTVGISLFTLQVTHRIARETDVERDHIVKTIADAAPPGSVGVEVIRNFSTGYHAVNGGGDAITTDGDLPFVDLRELGVSARGAASALLAESTSSLDSGASNRVKRPVSIYTSYLLMAVRGLIGVGSIIATLSTWTQTIRELQIDLPNGSEVDGAGFADALLWIVVVVGAVGLLAYLLLAQLMFWGYDGARFIAMTLSLVAVALVAVDFATTGAGLTLATGLVNLSFDIFVLFSLSSADARVFSRQRRARRLERRGGVERSSGGVGKSVVEPRTTAPG